MVFRCTLESERLVRSSCTHSAKKTLELREEIVSGTHVGLKSKVELAGSPRNRVKSTVVLIEVVVVRQQRMKVATREQWLFVLIEGMKGFFVYLLSFQHHSYGQQLNKEKL